MRILLHDYAGHAFPIGLSRELARRGHEVTHAFAGGLLTPRGSLKRNAGDPAGLRFLEVPMNPNYRRDKYRFAKRRKYERAYGKELQSVINAERPSIVLSGNTPSEPQWHAVKRCRSLGVPFVSWIQDFYSIAVKNLASKKSAVLGKLAGQYYSRLDRLCLKHSARAIPISEDFNPILDRYGVAADRITVIENWGAIAEIPSKEKENEWSKSQGLADKRVIMYSGTLAMKHNPEPLVDLAQYYRKDPSVRIVVISEGPGADYIKKRAIEGNIDNLVVLPFQPFESLPEVLGSADLFVALLEPDAGVFSVPSKILSYLCAGKPTLAAMPEENLAARLLARSGAGAVVQPGDVVGFIETAAILMADDKIRGEMGIAARKHAEANFEIGVVCDRFERVFNEIYDIDICKNDVEQELRAAAIAS